MKFITPTLILAASFILGCSTQNSTTQNGFQVETLSNGSQFAYKDKASLRGYDSIYIKSVNYLPSQGSNALTEVQSEELKEAFRFAFQSALAMEYTMANSPGPNTLVVNATIGDTVQANPVFRPMAENPADEVNTFGVEDVDGRPYRPLPDQHAAAVQLRLAADFQSPRGEPLAEFSTGPTHVMVNQNHVKDTNGNLLSAIVYNWCLDIKNELADLQ